MEKLIFFPLFNLFNWREKKKQKKFFNFATIAMGKSHKIEFFLSILFLFRRVII